VGRTSGRSNPIDWPPCCTGILALVVAEIGASNGKLTVAAAQRVGPSGRVYSTEIDAKALALLEELAAKEGNIVPIKTAEADTNLPPHPVTRYLCGSCIITLRDRLKSTQAFAGR